MKKWQLLIQIFFILVLIAGGGYLVTSPNLPVWEKSPLRRIARRSLGVYTVVDNDANAIGNDGNFSTNVVDNDGNIINNDNNTINP